MICVCVLRAAHIHTCVRTSTCDGSTVMCGWLWYQPTTRVNKPLVLVICSASAVQAAICSGLVSTRSCSHTTHQWHAICMDYACALFLGLWRLSTCVILLGTSATLETWCGQIVSARKAGSPHTYTCVLWCELPCACLCVSVVWLSGCKPPACCRPLPACMDVLLVNDPATNCYT